MDSKITKLVAGVALVGALAVGTAGAAFADDGSGGTTTTAPSAQAAKKHPGARLAIRREAVQVVTQTLGVSRQDLRAALKGGQTLDQYITSLGKDPQTVVEALTKAADAKLAQLVSAGTIKQARADAITSKLPARIDKLMNRQFGQHATT